MDEVKIYFMPGGFPSIKDLIPSASNKNASDLNTVQGQFTKKIQDIGIAEKEKEVEKQAVQIGLPYIDLSQFPVSLEALRVIPEAQVKELGAVCFFVLPDQIRLGIIEPKKELEELVYQLGERHHAEVQIYLISQHSLERVIGLYRNLPVVLPISKDIDISDEDLAKFQEKIDNLKSLQDSFADISISDVVTFMIASALKVKASDVHVEAEEKGIAVRYRIDGVLMDVAMLPIEQWKRFISRIKLLSGLKINITNKPQDGRVTLKLTKEQLDVRVSTLPTVYGESLVMRVLYGESGSFAYDDLGLRGKAYVQLKKEITRPNGMIITTGPTGSGKTTTMYAIVNSLNKPGVKIITLEDPVEIKMKGINQSQVDPAHDYTFAKGLRSLLRQDPDICMVGEIRDLETAEISIQAALTGHLMLSTIHTNNAAGAIPRFLSMGVKPFLLAPALNSVIGQRLVRRICPKCITEDELDSELLERVGKVLESLPAEEKANIDLSKLKFYRGAGCEECSGIGYKGRIGIYELFTMNKEIEAVILSGKVSEYEILDLTVKQGMISMVQDGLLKALDKVTTVDEVFRVTQ